MKKMMILMMVFGLSAVFVSCATTAPVDTSDTSDKGVYIDAGDWFITSYKDNKPTYFDNYSDSKKVEIYKALATEAINGKHLVYEGFEFCKVGWVAEKYYTYLFVKKDETYMILVNNVGDGRELRLCYSLKDTAE